MAALMGWAHPPNDSPQHDLKLHAWQMQGSAGYFEPLSPEISRQYNIAMHFLSNEIVLPFQLEGKWICVCSYRAPPDWLWCSRSQRHSQQCRHISQHPPGQFFQCANCRHSSERPFHWAEPGQGKKKNKLTWWHYYHTGARRSSVCFALSWKPRSPLQVFHFGTSIFPEVVSRPATCRECSGTGRCRW